MLAKHENCMRREKNLYRVGENKTTGFVYSINMGNSRVKSLVSYTLRDHERLRREILTSIGQRE